MTDQIDIRDTAARIGVFLDYIERMAINAECDSDNADALMGGIQSVAREANQLAQQIETYEFKRARGHYAGLNAEAPQ